MQFGISIPAFADFSDPRVLAELAHEAESSGWGGFFIWDAWNSSRISDIILALVYVGLVGYALDRIVAFLGRKVTPGTAAS